MWLSRLFRCFFRLVMCVLLMVCIVYYAYYDSSFIPTYQQHHRQHYQKVEQQRRRFHNTSKEKQQNMVALPATPPQLPINCPNMTLAGYIEDPIEYFGNVFCKPAPLDEKDCAVANRKYKKNSINNRCQKQHDSEIIHDLCSFKSINDLIITNKYRVNCNIEKCHGNLVQVATIDPTNGYITSFGRSKWASNAEELESVIMYLYENTKETFSVISCFFNNNFIKQALSFPPRVHNKPHREKSSHQDFDINLNIVVLDSVSRQHFYRQLPQTVEKLQYLYHTKKSTYHNKKPLEVFDFELFQSLAPRTFPNMRAMFSGTVDVDSDDEAHQYEIEVLFGHFRSLGYQTVLQEDSCWYDSWGALITDNKHRLNVSLDWMNIRKKIEMLPIDTYGLTHLSCEVFSIYGRTNQFNFPPKVCYNGHLFAEYFFNYTHQFISAIERDRKKVKPGFLYTHLNTGHETTGQRISQIDQSLAKFAHDSSRLKNTLTIIMSDHGPKTTRFSQEYLAGRYEIGHALLFMIIPPAVQNYIGKDKLEALRLNQRRLFSAVDLFHTFKTLSMPRGLGLLKPISKNRNCFDVPYYSFMNCICSQATTLVENTEKINWMAEFALGHLNEELNEGLFQNGHSFGNGNCERLIGRIFDKVRLSHDKEGKNVYIMDVIVDKYRGQEIFEVVLKVDYDNTSFSSISLSSTLSQQEKLNNFHEIKLVKWRRVTIYQHFSKCCDPNINVELCICRKESSGFKNPGRDVTRLLSIPFFNFITVPIFIDSKCLLLLKRGSVWLYLTYEITNICTDRVYDTKFELTEAKNKKVKTTRSLPIYKRIHSWFIYHLTTIIMVGQSLQDVRENVTFAIKYTS